MTILATPVIARPRFGWTRTIGLHLAPGALTFAAALLLAPLMRRLHLPLGFALTLAFALVLTPIELGLLLRAGRRATGRWSLRSVPAVLAYPRRLGRWWLLVPVLFTVALSVAVAWSPAAAVVGGWFDGVLPAWSLPSYDDTLGFAKPVLVATMLVTLVVDGVVNPVVEELYFRGYLLPRLPVAGWAGAQVRRPCSPCSTTGSRTTGR
jgi:membrane protease YdiL (CAAX protease family)